MPDFAQVLAQPIGAIEHYRQPTLDHRGGASRRSAQIKGESLIALGLGQAAQIVADEPARSLCAVKIGGRFLFRSLSADRGGSQHRDRSRRG